MYKRQQNGSTIIVRIIQKPYYKKGYALYEFHVRDNGIGIEDNIKAKIFEPFFTTKPTAEAAGVGLYLCREVILNHQGSIIVKSEKDNFTEFMITIPIYQKSNNNE